MADTQELDKSLAQSDGLNEDNTEAYTQEELQAIEEGWAPKDKWKGPEDEWVPAKAFLKYGKIESELKRTRSDSAQKEKLIGTMKNYYMNVKIDAMKEVLDTFRRQKREAIKNEDFQEVAKLDQQIEELSDSLNRKFTARDQQIYAAEQATPQVHPEFFDWNKRNSWYTPGDTSGLTREADVLAVSYAQMNPGANYGDVLKFVEKTIKANNPEKFQAPNPRRERPSDVAEPSELGGSEQKNSRVRLRPEEKAAAAAFGISEEEYAKGLKAWDRMKGVG